MQSKIWRERNDWYCWINDFRRSGFSFLTLGPDELLRWEFHRGLSKWVEIPNEHEWNG